MKTYKFKKLKGVDDLLSLYAFEGNSQGDTTATNSIENFNNSNGWLSFMFDCALTDEAIQIEIERRKKYNEDYIELLKANGEYLKEYKLSITLAPHPLFDESSAIQPMESYRFLLIDLTQQP